MKNWLEATSAEWDARRFVIERTEGVMARYGWSRLEAIRVVLSCLENGGYPEISEADYPVYLSVCREMHGEEVGAGMTHDLAKSVAESRVRLRMKLSPNLTRLEAIRAVWKNLAEFPSRNYPMFSAALSRMEKEELEDLK